MTNEKKLYLLDLIIRKGVAVGMIQLLIKEKCGGVKEYNDFIGDKKLFLTQDEFDDLVKLLK